MNYDSFEEHEHGFIYDLLVLPSYQRRGLGINLMKSAILSFKQQKAHEVRLNVYHNNPAKYLYERLGFHYHK
ncbi:GNAT family N-acetyltransferase [Pontibacillus yanchengensis]|uniref:GNAT family N-acetyltransferase n=2 Tax=Pontibacillus yanchengensis TaxID=462910 RepID=A0ACC7VBX0_9BACI|nr:GNAT family N-acetyltransferase [Pontibacillus yanchengensis]MYL34757.1 GNAT family N-acetyltransferase [Pontibacillus yanchengensis]MYL52257.1 GNAT family N-acetyltransferase [Pontibacillus yanchengensis]